MPTASYLDCNATTPLDSRVGDAMRPWLSSEFGNASSRDHRWGWNASDAVEEARALVADAIEGTSKQVHFVSGATEGLNTIIRGYVGLEGWSSKNVVTCATEHDAVLTASCYLCDRTGVGLEVVPVDGWGHIDLERLRTVVEATPGALVAIMAANNEIGTVHPVREIAAVVHACDGTFLCDTTQAFGKGHCDLAAEGIDFATLSAHKCHGPKGIGALIVGHGLENKIQPLIVGGGQERGLRGGTLNVPGIVGFGEACRLIEEHMDEDVARMRVLRDRLEDGVLSQVPDAWVNGDVTNRLCNTSNIGFRGVNARTMIRDMHDIAVSTRSACSSGAKGPSHVLKAIGLSDEDAYSCIRFSLGRFTIEEEIDYTIKKVVTSAHKLRRNKSVRI